jgi:glycosyltransferase involved in cell wall biosynthesis
MNHLPFVSVIVPVYNDPVRVAGCIEALLAQTYPSDRYEVLVVDNCSTDTTAEIVSRYPVRLLAEHQRQGSYAARNKALQEARGDIVAFTDSDCVPATNWIETGVARLQQQPRCGLLAGKVSIFFRDPAHPTTIELYERMTAFPQERYVAQEKYGATANVFTFMHVIQTVGTFDPNLKSSGDREWGKRVAAAGFEISYADDVCVDHPARYSMSELLQKRARIIGGHEQIRRGAQRYPVTDLLQRIARDISFPMLGVAQMYANGRLRGLPRASRVVLIILLVGYIDAWFRLRSYCAHAYRKRRAFEPNGSRV